MAKLRIAINGFGRIGRTVFKAGWGRKGIEFVVLNDLTEPKILAHLLKYDSVFRIWDHEVSYDAKHIIVNGVKIPVVAEKEPTKLPWKQYKVDVVIESTGRFTNMEAAKQHIIAGAKRVVISAPAKDVPTYLMGVNHAACPAKAEVINNASCTTNSIAPVMAIMNEKFGVSKAMMTTVHSATAEQNLVDGLPPALHPDLRRARSAMINIVPTSTGAAKATTEAIPELKGLFDGLAIRVPTIDVSLSDFTMVLKKKTTPDEINEVFKKTAKTPRWKGILGVSDKPLVSSDYIGSTYSSVVDLEMTRVVDGDLAKVMAWYDNEWGYSVHLMDMVEHVGKLLKR
ncbi:type I glyceraldehyde-3-phosphate dehydrogenase [Candidatus Uhrbacteria bacterium RIFCSPLOWO2_01_FULL_47_24]|uniref:Glyceraldehyde-3-phosphate dehydrogenase n=1 Tax=Candidatus Uhrbacteria bacterium RIFCSPLOWO2_01_FULL_47_24 TaxID=1802401 RepID=A0A1F7UQR2_9BACT|nr:MAG: type I glyceraldehyde-3-phosphate dehydrogenase [Alphaproteobacteria bacterium RIFCSPHIGHO2_01_FULL_40_8]OGL67878.1 MAG: type I glyceraldehyde-3-phosphate dehydrogenase [Candidatus Uhrbacteria bacterium RIFCSPHIGHO2_02_FULL_46_47]OGL75965.1 MAG: type I glyceraldehyde-3-phosphate dehydrogenase [Candidatus Uhrbacteria bacterium RIFCSPHIGHO2_12_FULL_47_11]OGL80064.1 MAG: type I glyceraldehyde-3-phosphate dehydrogenase [Candidatus Uhrbacteria bacterium RIFCSPLOWO2_01_FULL_47_24]OGL84850.1 M